MNGKKAKALRKLTKQYDAEFRPAGYTSSGKLLKWEPNLKWVPGSLEPKVFKVMHPGTLRNNSGSEWAIYNIVKAQHTAHHSNPAAGVSSFYVADTRVTTRGLLRYFRHFE
jgi:hypothetical protein